MTQHRDEYRTALRAAVAADPRFGSWPRLNIWAKSVNAEDLPMIGVGIPTDAEERVGLGNVEAATRVVVVVKRTGADLEDVEAEDAAAIRSLVVSALLNSHTGVDLTETSYSEDTSGQQPVSTLALMFRVTRVMPETEF